MLPLWRWLPEDNAVLTGLREGQLPKPADTVHIVAMDVSCGEYREAWVHTFSKNSTGICSEWTILRRRPEQDEPSVVNLLGHIDKFGDILPSKYNVQQ